MNGGKATIATVILARSVVCGSASTAVDPAPPAPTASPDVYRVLAESEQWRVIEATWQPGQEDNFHSHPGDRISVYTIDCQLRLTNPNGTFRDVSPKAGTAKVGTGKPVAAHKAKNIGDKACTLLIVELMSRRVKSRIWHRSRGTPRSPQRRNSDQPRLKDRAFQHAALTTCRIHPPVVAVPRSSTSGRNRKNRDEPAALLRLRAAHQAVYDHLLPLAER